MWGIENNTNRIYWIRMIESSIFFNILLILNTMGKEHRENWLQFVSSNISCERL